MNKLSWLLYLADVGDSLRILLLSVFVLLLLVTLLSGIASLVMADDDEFPHRRVWRAITWALVTLVLVSTLRAVVPSRATVHLIALSELGEQVGRLPETQQLAREAFDTVLGLIRREREK
jgi:O-antigen/teichoic acid export membrane protein